MKNVFYLQNHDIFTSKADVVVIAVNCLGVAGRGQALQCARSFPWWEKEYQEACKNGSIAIGKPYLHAPHEDYWFLDFPTKNTLKPSTYEYISAGLRALPQIIAENSISSLALPKLGCGYGRLAWEQVGLLIQETAEKLPCKVFIYV